jgi:hypothetical protein
MNRLVFLCSPQVCWRNCASCLKQSKKNFKLFSLPMKTIRAGQKFICRVEGRSMEPTLLPEDMLVVEWCDGASLHDGDLVVMRNSLPARQAGVEAPIVHRLLGKCLSHEKDGFILRTRGDNLLLRDETTWTEDQCAGKVTCLLRRTATGHQSVLMHARMNRRHAALDRCEERLYLYLRSLKRRLIGSRTLALSGLIVRAVHGLTRKAHMWLNYLAAQYSRKKRVCR